ncbi:hypothetical protein BKI49_02060 [Streptomyces sp. Tue6028]|uniref:hypothetical protein n=1 Tax=Streptomyces sp. Tue6028 TaxID=2036037 RepID=UPI000BB3A43A|nr:hypothetical protein [Streptomyces sp. Tue6028]PBC65538.1 hypothetical protein BKI49_02060 [Streptomyces sp. Tue6028]
MTTTEDPMTTAATTTTTTPAGFVSATDGAAADPSALTATAPPPHFLGALAGRLLPARRTHPGTPAPFLRGDSAGPGQDGPDVWLAFLRLRA